MGVENPRTVSLAYEHLGYRGGRLGNQLWEIASTIGVAKSNGLAPAFPASWAYRNFFSVPDEYFFHDDYCHAQVQAWNHSSLAHIDERARQYMQDFSLWKYAAYEVEKALEPTALAKGVLKQFEWYWELPKPLLTVHVRRGDNVAEASWKTPYFPVPTAQYYRDAIAVQDSYASLVFFSDDLPWCFDTFGSEYPAARYFHGGDPMPAEINAYNATRPTDWIDFFALCSADLSVVSNSTFGWWGAYLSKATSPVYPRPWYGPALSHVNSSLMMPAGWRELSYVA